MIVKRLLGDEYFSKCLEISKIRPRVGGTVPISDAVFRDVFVKYFENDDNSFAFGCFDNNELISWIGIGFGESESAGKFWAISTIYTTKFTPYFSFNNEEIGLLIKTAFEFAESKKYYEYYYTVSARISNVYERQIQKNKFIPIGRYDYRELKTIPANTKPTSELIWRLMGQETKPDPTIVKKRILRPQFRKLEIS
jgi:hypothetical protein